MPRRAVPSRPRAQPSPRSRTRNDAAERSGHSSARRRPNSVSASHTAFGSRSVSTAYATLATELLLLRHLLVDRHVREVVGAAVELSGHVLDFVGHRRQQALHLGVELLQLRLLDLVVALDLLDDEVRVDEDLEPVWLPVPHGPEALDQRVVLGLVVRHVPEPLVPRLEPQPVLVLDEHARPSRTGVAAGGPVRPETQNPQAITRIRLQFSQLTTSSPLRRACMPDDVTVTWHARHWLRSTSATGGCERTRRYACCARGDTCAHSSADSAVTAASSLCHDSRPARSPGSSEADRARVS